MRKLPLPTADPSEVFLTCISRIRDPAFKERLKAVEPHIAADAAGYILAAADAQLHTVACSDSVGGLVDSKEMAKVYDQRMARRSSPGRPIYDKLLLAPEHGICPLCGLGRVSTLDHHLPKSCYPSLAVVPANLVPACSDCNKAKGSARPHTSTEQTMHPYFDETSSDVWLYADVIEEFPVAFRYFVSPPSGWDETTKVRVENHFNMFRLAELYSAHAAAESASIQYEIDNLLTDAGPGEVRAHLWRRAESCAHFHLNSWRTAMYRALAECTWYYSGGIVEDHVTQL